MRNNLYTVMGLDLREINWFPTSTIEEILQNVAVLLTTLRGSVVLDRKLGLNATFIDSPIERAKIHLVVFVRETIQRYEPRATVTNIDFVPDPQAALDGRLFPRLTVRIADEHIS